MNTSLLSIRRIFTLLSIFTLTAILLVSIFYTRNKVQAQTRVILKESDLYSISEILGEKRLTNSRDVKILFDEQYPFLLFGRGWGNENEAEGLRIGGGELWLLHTETGEETKIFSGLEVNRAFFGSGETIYLTTRNQNLFVSDFKANTKRLQEKVLTPSISRDEKFLVYQKLPSDWEVGEYYDRALGLTVLDLSTGVERKITSRWEDWGPVFVPNGRKILFSSINKEGLASHFVVNVDDLSRTQLTNFGEKSPSEKTVPLPSETPVFSKSGRFLAYESDRNIWLLTFDTEFSKVIKAQKIAFGINPKFSQDERFLSVVVSPDRKVKQPILNIDLSRFVTK